MLLYDNPFYPSKRETSIALTYFPLFLSQSYSQRELSTHNHLIVSMRSSKPHVMSQKCRTVTPHGRVRCDSEDVKAVSCPTVTCRRGLEMKSASRLYQGQDIVMLVDFELFYCDRRNFRLCDSAGEMDGAKRECLFDVGEPESFSTR